MIYKASLPPLTDPEEYSFEIGEVNYGPATIFDIRREKDEYSILEDIKTGLRPRNGESKTLPTLLLYDVEGLKLFEEITYLDEYYLTNAEIEVLERSAKDIAERIQPGSIILELGSGNLRKIEILLKAIEWARKDVDYFALDVSLDELERTLSAVPQGRFHHVRCHGLHGTYDDGFEWLKSEKIAKRPKFVLSMGSSIGNFPKKDAIGFLTKIANEINPGDVLIIGIDACKNPEKVYHAYNDDQNVTHRFISNGLRHANRLLGSDEFNLDAWSVVGQYDEKGGRHVAYVSPNADATVDGIRIKMGEKIQIEESNKYSTDETNQLFAAAELVQGATFANQSGDYAIHMAYKPPFMFPTKPENYAATPVPSVADWESLWTVWDIVTRQMIPEEELLSKPIKLRNACLFYLGHIPTFLDIHLARATGESSKELEYYQKIFERGIDPDVDNPELCHDHSEVPDTWPPVEEIIEYQERVRCKVRNYWDSGSVTSNHALGKAMWIGFEHEVMHMETLLYMLIQSDKTIPPEGVLAPDFKTLAIEAERNAVPNEWIDIPARTVKVGLNDPDDDTETKRYFGWDNEKPARVAKVADFQSLAKPITNREYAEYLEQTGSNKLPASWVSIESNTNGTVNGHQNGVTNGIVASSFVNGKAVRTVFGMVSLKYVLDWPVMASYDDINGFAKWSGNGRIPTEEELRSIYEYAEEMKRDEAEKSISKTIPAVNGHLINNGVEETPPHDGNQHRFSSNDAVPSQSNLFIDLARANVGLKNWHPVPVNNDNKLAGHAEAGGVWEWTSTVLEKHEGFEPMELYPGYTADFFDGKHNVVLGGSWATHPRIAGRKTFVNWYQRNYPFVWAGARLVRDA